MDHIGFSPAQALSHGDRGDGNEVSQIKSNLLLVGRHVIGAERDRTGGGKASIS